MASEMEEGAAPHTAMERGPCDKHKQDICQSIRYQMLSVRPPSPVADITLHVSAVLQLVNIHVPPLGNLAPSAGRPGVFLNPVLSFSLPFSSQVLRI